MSVLDMAILRVAQRGAVLPEGPPGNVRESFLSILVKRSPLQS